MASPAQKLYYRIGEVAQLTGVEPHVLRYWETEFPQLRPQKNAAGQRRYSRADLETVRRIKDLLYEEGFTIVGARRQLRGSAGSPSRADLAWLDAELRTILTLLKGE